jgi:hypothetical protein
VGGARSLAMPALSNLASEFLVYIEHNTCTLANSGYNTKIYTMQNKNKYFSSIYAI